MSEANKDKCECGESAAHECSRCKKIVCDDNNCGQDTVDGYFCGSYTIHGCSRKYTTCDTCLDDKAIHEEDLNYCDICSNSICDKCMEDNSCTKCEGTYCGDCIDQHVEECDN